MIEKTRCTLKLKLLVVRSARLKTSDKQKNSEDVSTGYSLVIKLSATALWSAIRFISLLNSEWQKNCSKKEWHLDVFCRTKKKMFQRHYKAVRNILHHIPVMQLK